MFRPGTNTNLHIDGPAEPPIDGRAVAWAYQVSDTAVAVACPYGCGLVHYHSFPVACPMNCFGDHEHIPLDVATRSAHGEHPWVDDPEYVLLRAEPFRLLYFSDLERKAGEVAAALGWPYRTRNDGRAA